MRLLFSLLLLLILLPLRLVAQEDEGTFLERQLQDLLSGAGREVSISGFAGALSSNARMDRMTVADADGVWLIMHDAELVWTRSALLRGRLRIDSLGAREIEILRAPKSEEDLSLADTETKPFALPELPISVNIDALSIETIRLGPDLLGEEVEMQATGRLKLEAGDGDATLDIRRTDRADKLSFDGGFSNSNRVLRLDMDFDETAGGLVSRLLKIPGAPQLGLQIRGEAPLSDFTAEIALSSDNQPRFGGQVTIRSDDSAESNQRVIADLSGDVRPLFIESFHPFFGDDTSLFADALLRADGATVLNTLTLRSGALDIDGTLSIGPDGWPERFSLSGEMGQDGVPVRLPMSGAATTVTDARIAAQYDAATGERWSATIDVQGLEQEELRFENATLAGGGMIARLPETALIGLVSFGLTEFTSGDAALDEAIGSNPQGSLRFDWKPDAPLNLSSIALHSDDLHLRGRAAIDRLSEGVHLDGSIALEAQDISRFAAVTERDLAGAGKVQLEGQAVLLTGAFDGVLSATTTGLQIGEKRADPILKSRTELRVAATRNESGLNLNVFTLENTDARISASGQLNTAQGQMFLQAALPDVSLVEPRLTGDAEVSGRVAWAAGAPLRLENLIARLGETRLSATGQVTPEDPALPVSGRMTLEADDLSRFAALAQRPLAGRITLNAEGSGEINGAVFDGVFTASADGLRTGEARIDPLLRGRTDLDVKALKDETGVTLERFSLIGDEARVIASGRLDPETGHLDLQSSLSDAALVEPRLSGDAELAAQLSWEAGAPVRLSDLNARLGRSTLRASGTLDHDNRNWPITGRIDLVADDLSRFARLAGQPLAGRLTLNAEGGGELRGDVFDLRYDLDGADIRSGIAQLDAVIAGTLSSEGSLALSDQALDLRFLRLAAARLSIDATGSGPGAPITLAARLADLGLLTPELSGPAEARGTATLREARGRDIEVDLNASGPGGITAQIVGNIRDYGRSLGLSVTGQAPLQLVNPFIAPQSVQGDARFDLRIDGPPGLEALTGQVNFAGARAALPEIGYALEDLDGAIDLRAGRAGITLSGSTGGEGTFTVSGPITLAPPFNGELAIGLQRLNLTDGELYSTSLDGRIDITGPLTGGALIRGIIDLGKTEIRVPSGSGVILGTLPDLTHIAEPAAVRQTRERAGLIRDTTGPGASFPIDLTINARQQIFVRGRGLDAELGGALRLTGTTTDVRASGVFNLIRGRLDILGKRLNLTEGLIDMRGSLDPYLRFVAETEADDVIVRIILEGLVSAPNVLFTSVPELPQEEVIARLLFSRGLDSISPFQAAQLVGAVAQLTGRYDGGVVGKLRSSLGLSDLDVTTTADGATQFSAGAYISDNVYSEVTADSDGKQQINLNFDVSRSLTVRGSASSQGDTGIGIFYEKDY